MPATRSRRAPRPASRSRWSRSEDLVPRRRSSRADVPRRAACRAGVGGCGRSRHHQRLYITGGSAGQPYNQKFVELYNPTSEAVDISEWSLQYRAATNSAPFSVNTKYDLDGIIQPGKHFLVAGNSNGSPPVGAPLPTPDQVTTLAPAAGGGTPGARGSTELIPALTGDLTGTRASDNSIVDLIGFGTSNTYETAVAPAPGATSVRKSINRAGFADTDNNAVDFTLSETDAVTPQNCGATCVLPLPPPINGPIAQIQGDGPKSPQRRGQATTRGVVTAVYKTGGFSGAYIQSPGTGGAVDLATHTASDGIFVFGSAFAAAVDTGTYVEVTGKVVEFGGMTELTAPDLDGP
ncbi:lamin tail domain-containing protein [Aeromicrobium sp. UC242_57]|uniref:lamin tail domain-containing protein n=1 Tax=Aeromicrobium sp. UC242_57 TaxID=3374624 RepID=UPI0037B25AD4